MVLVLALVFGLRLGVGVACTPIALSYATMMSHKGYIQSSKVRVSVRVKIRVRVGVRVWVKVRVRTTVSVSVRVRVRVRVRV